MSIQTLSGGGLFPGSGGSTSVQTIPQNLTFSQIQQFRSNVHEGGYMWVQDFGVDITGATDSLSAMQDALDWTGYYRQALLIPAGAQIKCSDTLHTLFRQGWSIQVIGGGSTTTNLICSGTNRPVLVNGDRIPTAAGTLPLSRGGVAQGPTITNDSVDNNHRIIGLAIGYAALAAYTDTNSYCIQWTYPSGRQPSQGWELDDIFCYDGYYGMYTDPTTQAIPWECRFGTRLPIRFGRLTGAPVYMSSTGAAAPNFNWGTIYARADSTTPWSQTAFRLKMVDSVIQNLEINNNVYNAAANGGAGAGGVQDVYFFSGSKVVIHTFRTEIETLPPSTVATQHDYISAEASCQIWIDNASFSNTHTIPTGVKGYAFRPCQGGQSSITVGNLSDLPLTAGISDSPGFIVCGHSGYTVQGSFRIVGTLPPGNDARWISNGGKAAITDNGTTDIANLVRIDHWANDLISTDIGNGTANVYTCQYGGPTRLYCNTALTAALTITVPSDNRMNFAGARWTVIKTATAGTTFAINVKDAGGTTIATIPAATVSGSVEVQWLRTAAATNGGWIQVR